MFDTWLGGRITCYQTGSNQGHSQLGVTPTADILLCFSRGLNCHHYFHLLLDPRSPLPGSNLLPLTSESNRGCTLLCAFTSTNPPPPRFCLSYPDVCFSERQLSWWIPSLPIKYSVLPSHPSSSSLLFSHWSLPVAQKQDLESYILTKLFTLPDIFPFLCFFFTVIVLKRHFQLFLHLHWLSSAAPL